MWIRNFTQGAYNAAHDYLNQKVKGRFLSFAIQYIVSYIAVGLFTLMITMVAVSMLNQGDFSLDLFSSQGLIEWLTLIEPIWTVSSVIGVNYLFQANLSDNKMSFPDFYRLKSSGFWLDLIIALTILSIALSIYHRTLFLSGSAAPTNLELLLQSGYTNSKFHLASFFSRWLLFISQALPFIVIVIIEIRERKRNGCVVNYPIWKIFIAAVVIGIILNVIMNYIQYMFGELVLNLIYAPFELVEIPIAIGVVVLIFFETYTLILLSAFLHFTIKRGVVGVASTSSTLPIDHSTDLLDN